MPATDRRWNTAKLQLEQLHNETGAETGAGSVKETGKDKSGKSFGVNDKNRRDGICSDSTGNKEEEKVELSSNCSVHDDCQFPTEPV